MSEEESAKLQELRRIAENNDGILDPVAVIKYADNPKSPLHKYFQWDDTEAAHQYRLWQARQLIRTTVHLIDFEGEKRPVRVFVSLKSDREEGGYREMNVVLSNKDCREQLLQDALEELEVFQSKYKLLRELAEVFEAVKRVRKKAA